eukprot:scaffold13677_cov138-Skeletonema_marinoi.AAC.3
MEPPPARLLEIEHNRTAATTTIRNNDNRQLNVGGSPMRLYHLALAICCGLFGYIIGSMPNNNLTGHVDVKSSRQPSYKYDADSQMKGIDHIHPTNKSSIIEEIIPATLQPIYQNIQFNVTRSMLRQSRPIIGNTQRLHAYLEKLRNKQCTTVLFLGGSVTDGHNAGGAKNAYPKLFMDWLNEAFSCVSVNGTMGKHEYIPSLPGIKNSQTAFLYFDWIDRIEKLDLVFTEFNVNDAFLADYPPHALEDKINGTIQGDLRYFGSAFYFEVLLRRLLLLRKPDPIAIVTFNADYIGTPWSPAYRNFETDQKSLFRRNMEPLKLYISSVYEIPVFSAVSWMLPMAEEERALASLQYSDRADIERDFTADPVPLMRDPLYLSSEEDIAYVTSIDAEERLIDFTNPDDNNWEGKVLVNKGWTWYADNKFNDKYGLITNNSAGESHVAISLTGGKNGLVEISYVISYENFGRGFAWVDDSQDNTKQGLCKKVLHLCKMDKGNDATWRTEKRVACQRNVDGAEMVSVLNGIWKVEASVQTVTLLREKLPHGQQKFLHVCLTPPDESQRGTENKFKLLSVRTF